MEVHNNNSNKEAKDDTTSTTTSTKRQLRQRRLEVARRSIEQISATYCTPPPSPLEYADSLATVELKLARMQRRRDSLLHDGLALTELDDNDGDDDQLRVELEELRSLHVSTSASLQRRIDDTGELVDVWRRLRRPERLDRLRQLVDDDDDDDDDEDDDQDAFDSLVDDVKRDLDTFAAYFDVDEKTRRQSATDYAEIRAELERLRFEREMRPRASKSIAVVVHHQFTTSTPRIDQLDLALDLEQLNVNVDVREDESQQKTVPVSAKLESIDESSSSLAEDDDDVDDIDDDDSGADEEDKPRRDSTFVRRICLVAFYVSVLVAGVVIFVLGLLAAVHVATRQHLPFFCCDLKKSYLLFNELNLNDQHTLAPCWSIDVCVYLYFCEFCIELLILQVTEK